MSPGGLALAAIIAEIHPRQTGIVICWPIGLACEDLKSMGISDLYTVIFKIWRAKRLEKFREVIEPAKGESILDIGGYPHTWITSPQVVDQIDCLNLNTYPWPEEKDFPDHRIRIMEGNGCSLRFGDKAYAIVFSNSVIEHVGDLQAQVDFAAEARRVGQRLWIQTPARECPFEPHFLTPFIHWFPPRFRKRVARYCTVWGLLEKPSRHDVEAMVNSIRLLSKKEMRRLFPDHWRPG